MGGKTLRFPKRKKFISDSQERQEKKEVTPEEHEAKLKILRDMGIIK